MATTKAIAKPSQMEPPGYTPRTKKTETARRIAVGWPAMLKTKVEKGETSRTNPVALRANMPPDVAGPFSPDTSLIPHLPLRPTPLSRHQVLIDDAVRLEVDQAAVEVTAAVVRAGVDGDSAPDPGHTLALVDLTVKAEQRLRLLDDLAHLLAAGGDLVRAAALGHVPQFVVDLVGGVEARLVRRHVDVEDRPLGLLELVDERLQPRVDLLVVKLARRLPRGPVGVAEGDHLVRPDLAHRLVPGGDRGAGGEDLGHRPGIVVAGDAVGDRVGPAEPLVGELDPEPQLVEQRR